MPKWTKPSFYFKNEYTIYSQSHRIPIENGYSFTGLFRNKGTKLYRA